MKKNNLVVAALLGTSLVVGMSTAFAADNITTDAAKTGTTPMSKSEISDPSVAATSFVEHINYARVALAMKNADLAKQHITQARNMMEIIKAATAEQRIITKVESGRIVYQYDTKYKFHYFPIQTGPVTVKQITNGPIWAKNDLAVSDADVVYLTIDFTGNTAVTRLGEAESAIAANNLKLADEHLAQIIEAVVKVDSKESLPNLKAHDNIALARHFIDSQNYAGASYALKHADEALDDLQKKEKNKPQLEEITEMRKDVSTLQEYITKKDPGMIQKANTKIEKWWKDLTNWGKNSK